MTIEEQLTRLEQAIDEFTSCVIALLEGVFFQTFTEWSPRDVVAHLIGWNRYTITGCEQLQRGELPFYFINQGKDFSKINAISVQRYAAQNRQVLLSELKASYLELRNFLLSLPSTAWETDYGVRYGKSPITIKNTVEALLNDYIHHRKEIEQWAAGS